MNYIPTDSGFMVLEDSVRLLGAIFPNYPSLVPCHAAPALEPFSQLSALPGTCHHGQRR